MPREVKTSVPRTRKGGSLGRREIINTIAKKLKIPPHLACEALDTILSSFHDAFASGRDVTLARFGRFCVVNRKERLVGGFEAPGKVFKVPARTTVQFRPSRVVREKLAKTGAN